MSFGKRMSASTAAPMANTGECSTTSTGLFSTKKSGTSTSIFAAAALPAATRCTTETAIGKMTPPTSTTCPCCCCGGGFVLLPLLLLLLMIGLNAANLQSILGCKAAVFRRNTKETHTQQQQQQ